MVLYVVGLGLGDEKDITIKGLEAVKSSAKVYLEFYTSLLGGSTSVERMEAFYGKQLILADREFVESGCEGMLEESKTMDVSFLVVGDPFGATTHTDLIMRAKELNITVKIVHNASIMNAVGCCGLQLYTFGQTISMVFFTDTYKPDSFYDRVKSNRQAGLHTLCLLDIKVKEQTIENMLRGRKVYEPPRFMTVNQCAEQLLEIEDIRGEKVYDENTLCVGMARVGQDDQQVITGTMKELVSIDFGAPLHSFIICGDMHFHELDFFNSFRINKENKFAFINWLNAKQFEAIDWLNLKCGDQLLAQTHQPKLYGNTSAFQKIYKLLKSMNNNNQQEEEGLSQLFNIVETISP
ncbi:diphthamide biosynthesis protein 5 [Cavenderia fasciculata]|uniref:diphthine methyl ester synthase n=1 Tax=Cavenderia fasciculata TaxID=261658 RepID=F4PZN1_CACFS|nr:diphthamide biosynthesis protein 5 [Cavenderia fasciculata]EGG18795.1 diphthamide biosynthesis protein 5 [Cavenderia fasciculata]|eukprot:XP_004357257.1 diphthamide biosynthesis protein 5 [Cavenderia fasciculata]